MPETTPNYNLPAYAQNAPAPPTKRGVCLDNAPHKMAKGILKAAKALHPGRSLIRRLHTRSTRNKKRFF